MTVSPDGKLQVLLILAIFGNLLLIGCGAEINNTPGKEQSTEVPETKTDSLLADLITRFHTSGLDETRIVARNSGLLDQNDNLKFKITLDTALSSESVETKLKELGAIVTAKYQNYMMVRINLEDLAKFSQKSDFWDNISSLKEVLDIKIVIQPPTTQINISNQQGIELVGADRWQQVGYRGQGVKVGIIDTGFLGYQDYLGTALPESGHVKLKSFIFGNGEGSDRHGIEVSEVVHSIAPDSTLFLAAIEDEVGFAQAVDWLLDNSVQIIQVALAWGGMWPTDGSSFLSKKLEEARTRGALPVVAAGNYAKSHYVSEFHPDANGFHIFGNGQNTLKFTPDADSAWVSLIWEEDYNNPITNLDLFILDESQQPKGSSRSYQGKGSKKAPVELVPFSAKAGQPNYIQVRNLNKADSSKVRFHLFAYNGTIEEYTPAESIAIPADAVGVLTVGATSWNGDYLEAYSSRGPTADGRNKPEIVGPSVAQLHSQQNEQNFGGTSASAPQVSGVAALVWGAVPNFSGNQVEKYIKHNAIWLGSASEEKPDPSSGYGRVRLSSVEAIKGGSDELIGAVELTPPQKVDFSNNQGGLPDNSMAYYGKLPSGGSAYFVRSGEQNELNWNVFSNLSYNEFRAEFIAGFSDATTNNGFFWGFVFWQRSSNDYSLFCVNNGWYSVLQRRDGIWQEIIPWKRDDALTSELKPVKLTFEATAGYLKIKAGDKILESKTLTDPQIGGKLGFASGSFISKGNTQSSKTSLEHPIAMFSELVITPLTSQ